MAKAAQRLLELAKSPDLDAQAIAALELGAAMLCHHVGDWREEAGLEPKDREAFKVAFPQWGPLSYISNGLKHAKPYIRQPSLSEVRPVEWEDADFWSADHKRPILFIDVRGEQRAISALVFNLPRPISSTLKRLALIRLPAPRRKSRVGEFTKKYNALRAARCGQFPIKSDRRGRGALLLIFASRAVGLSYWF